MHHLCSYVLLWYGITDLIVKGAILLLNKNDINKRKTSTFANYLVFCGGQLRFGFLETSSGSKFSCEFSESAFLASSQRAQVLHP
uniref:Secreted protein n=1 Tax=Rodentolepis nana TaxID=102285 RepID=A0A0R3TEX4_RODNA